MDFVKFFGEAVIRLVMNKKRKAVVIERNGL